MAEIVLPMLGLGAMYILSNEDKKNKLASKNINNQYSNINQTQFSSNNNSQKLVNHNQHTDRTFNENNYLNIPNQKTSFGVGNNNGTTSIKSINGNEINQNEFTHNNMVPFFGSKIRGATTDNQLSQTILDNKQGSGSQQFKKVERAPLFSPEDNISNSYGMANNTDFYQSRVNVGNNMSNVTLWEQQKVAPGLNLDYNSNNNMGFNSGMNAREVWQPKNVDSLRVANNPKLSYELTGHEGPAGNQIKSMGSIGKVEKHLPDKFYNNDPSRWLTTNGLEKAQTQRAEPIMFDQNRQNTTIEYFGNGTDSKNTTYSQKNFEESKKNNLQGLPISNASATGRSNNNMQSTFTNVVNNRTTTRNQLDFGAVSGLAQAILTPIMDILKPTRKENVIGNLRQSGNVQNSVTNGYLFNKNDTLPVTNRQMFSESINHLNVQAQNGDGYITANHEILGNQRDTTCSDYTGGSSGATNMGFKSNEAVYNQRNNVNKTYKLRPNQGGTQMFNQQMNVLQSRNDNDRNNNRMWVPTNAPKNYNNTILSADNSRGLQTYDQKLNNDRMNPDLLSAFKNNPYTQSLQSVA
tara:strand:+ start:1141 stop:2874 length:1734 start_codon:yes stop_codon:yes gene_type:complete